MFQLVFKGECTPGTDPQAARSNARTLFKATVEQVDRMFSGQPVVIRNKLEEVQAEKYRAVLKKHGMVAYVQPMEGEQRPRPAPAPAAEKQPPARPAERPAAVADTPRPSSSPTSPESTGKPSQTPAVEPGDRLPVAGEEVDSILAGSGLSLDPPGVTLMERKEVEPPMFQHLDEWSLAPPGSDLGVRRDVPPPMVPDVSHLSLADEGEGSKP